MALWHLLLCAALVDLPAVELETVKGDRHKGQLVELTPAAVTLRSGEANVQVPLAEVLVLQFPASKPGEPITPAAVVALLDGSRLTCTKFSIAGTQAQLETVLFGPLAVPVSALAHVRFGLSGAKQEEAWSGLLARESKKDLLVVKKGDLLDHLAGVVGEVDDKVKFLLDGDEIPVNREKVYGIVYASRAAAAKPSACRVELAGGDALQAAQVAWNGAALVATLAVGPQMTVPVEKIQSLDFSSGKVRYLSSLEPREMKHVPYFGEREKLYDYRRDRSLGGGPLRLGRKSYSRGLAIYSQTRLKYRIGGEYSRFQAVMGIDAEVAPLGVVDVEIKGDGKVLHKSKVRGVDPPVPLDLDVTGVRDLEIFVDYGLEPREDGLVVSIDLSDHLDLADAKLIK